MAAVRKLQRPWDIDDLLDLGKKGGITYMKAIPVLILDKWEREQRQEGVANYFRTKDLARRLESSKLVAGFKSKGTSNVGSGLVKMQNARYLTNPPLIRYEGGGVFWINLPSYEPLLQEYRQIYRRDAPENDMPRSHKSRFAIFRRGYGRQSGCGLSR